MDIIKASGEKVSFDPEKLRQSLRRVGADEYSIDAIVTQISNVLHENMSTRDIYRIAFQRLKNISRTLASKYHLKRAMMRLGSSGFPFEKYMAEIFRDRGFTVAHNQIVKGYCIDHEMDVVAGKDPLHLFIECKYHNRQGRTCDIQTALYVQARMLDIQRQLPNTEKMEGWLITNTRFTRDAMQYARCAGLHLMGWDYPAHNSLKEWVERSGLYPITCLTNLRKRDFLELFSKGIVLCRSINEHPHVLDSLRLSDVKRHLILKQCQQLCNIHASHKN